MFVFCLFLIIILLVFLSFGGNGSVYLTRLRYIIFKLMRSVHSSGVWCGVSRVSVCLDPNIVLIRVPMQLKPLA